MTDSIYDESRVLDTYPVIIIGAGLGGLGAACQLAAVGKKVLLLEKHNVPGGFASSFVRGRFEFDSALHALTDIGIEDNKGSIYRFLERIGAIPDKIQFKQIPEMYRSVFLDGYDVTIPISLEEYTEKLIELFPSEKKGIEEFVDMCQKVLEGTQFMVKRRGQYSPAEILKEHPWLIRVSGITLSELLNKFFTNKRLISVIAHLWGYLGVPPSRLNAYAYVAMIITFLTWGAAYPVGRSHALTTAMVNAIEELGSEIRYNALVNRILVKDERVIGIELINGDIYQCKAVISNVNPICTNMKMLPKNTVPDSFKKKIYAPEIGPSAFSVYLGLNASHKELGLHAHETAISETDDMDEAYETFAKIAPPKYMVAGCYNHIYEDISPPGTTQLCITTLQMGKIWHTISPDQYFKVKDYLTDKIIEIIEKTICPNVRENIEIVEAATPLTYYRYSKNLEGAIYGYTQDLLDGPNLRLKSRGSIPGLYQCGAWTNISGGFSASILSGRIAAGMYLKDIKEGRW